MKLTLRAVSWLFLLAAVVVAPCAAQESAKDAQAAAPASGPPSFRYPFLQVMQVETASHFAYTDMAAGKVVERDLSYRLTNRVQVNLLPDGRTYLQTRFETGKIFNYPWLSTGVGEAPAAFTMNVKSLYLGQRIGSHAEAEVGGIEFEPGAGTGATYAPGEAWLTGYRLRLSGSGNGWQPDRFTITTGYVGDFTTPNFFARGYRLGEPNYVQALLQKKLGTRFLTSAEYDALGPIHFTREAVRFRRLRSRLLDEATLEAVTHVSGAAAFGWSVSLQNTLDHRSRWRSGFIYSDIPTKLFSNQAGQPLLLNWGEVGVGKRAAFLLRCNVLHNLEFGVMGSHRLDATPNTMRMRAVAYFRFDLADMLGDLVR